MTERKRIFILVKTYPRISKRYGELVCTAGIQEDGTWIRLYPIRFRLLDFEKRYKKYTWINVDTERHTRDSRIESYRPDIETLIVEPELPKIRGKTDWETRRHIVLGRQKIYTSLRQLISEARTTKKSLAVFKPSRIIAVKAKKCSDEWDKDTLEYWKAQAQQLNMFDAEEEIREIKLAQKIPYEFRYTFEDDEGKKASLFLEDWETGMLYLNCMNSKNNEQAAVQDVKNKYMKIAEAREVYFFLGTTKRRHNTAKNPFIIVGVFAPPSPASVQQLHLF